VVLWLVVGRFLVLVVLIILVVIVGRRITDWFAAGGLGCFLHAVQTGGVVHAAALHLRCAIFDRDRAGARS
jgi:hypothetical protein